MRMRRCWIAALVFAADRATKIWAMGRKPAGEVLIPGVLGLRYAENRGIAFSLFSGSPVLPAVLAGGVLLLAAMLLRERKMGALPETGLMMMLGGALGNLADRIFLGYVPDWIELLFVRFAIFNAADMCLTVGCALVIWSLLSGPGDGRNFTEHAGSANTASRGENRDAGKRGRPEN